MLGRWQRLILFEMDEPKDRQVVFHVFGELVSLGALSGWPCWLSERRKTRQVRVGDVDDRRRRADPRPVDDHDEDRRHQRDPPADRLAGRGRASTSSGWPCRTGRTPRRSTAIAAKSTVPVVADIHFQWKYAMAALEAGIQGLRINPGNIKYQDKVRLIAREAKARSVPIRIGVNAGSLEKDLLAKHGAPTPEALVESALNEARILEEEDFFDIKISVKHSNPRVMIEAYRLLAEACDYPLHLGVTEAGPMPIGGVKSAVGIGTLLAEGIGDTIRVSLTDDPVEEVKVGTWILQSLGLRKRGLDLVACPSLRSRGGRRPRPHQAGARGDRARGAEGADPRRRDGLRRERARRGSRGRPRDRGRQGTGVPRGEGRGGRQDPRGSVRRAADRGGREDRRRARATVGRAAVDRTASRAEIPDGFVKMPGGEVRPKFGG